MIRLFLLSCSVALLCLSGASVIYIRETFAREELRKEEKERAKSEEAIRREKREDLDEHYAYWSKYNLDKYEEAKKKTIP